MQLHVYGENAKNTNLAGTLSNVYCNLCDYNAARMNYKKALDMQPHVHSEIAKNSNLARTLECLGIVDSELGDYKVARMNYEKALEMYWHE
jgi:tetratricopeptide (TPR) repeat protein